MGTSEDLSQFSQEYIDYDQGPAMIVTCVVFGLLSLFTVGLRLWARKIKGVSFGVEDWLIVVCVPLVIGTVICVICAVHFGRVGRHYAVNMIVDAASYGRSLASLLAVECIYGTLLVVVKFSILAMYSRIFPTPFVQRGCYILGAMTLAWAIAVALVVFLQCQPIQKIWLPDTPGHCIDNNKFFIGNAVPNMATDLGIMLLPAYEISRLQMNRVQKFTLACIFLLGIFVTFVSGIRLIFLFRLSAGGPEGDQTVLIAVPWVLTVVEGECAVICACLPLLKPIAQLVFRRYFPSSKGKSKPSKLTRTGLGEFPSSIPTNPRSRSVLKGQYDSAGGGFARLSDTESAKAVLEGYDAHKTCTNGSGENKESSDDNIPLEDVTRHGNRMKR